MNNKRTFLAALVLSLALTTPALGGIIHSDAPAPAPTPASTSTTPEGGNTVQGIIHSDETDDAAATGTLTEAAIALAQLIMSLI